MLMKIGEITSEFNVSHRSLHYWEDMGIIKSSRAENEYRYYDEENQQKIKQILILRKLRLPLKQIIMVLESDNTAAIIDTLQRNLNNVDDEITALSTIRSILDSFITKLNENMMIDIKVNLLDDSTILEIADSLTIIKPVLKEGKKTEDLIQANEKLNKLTDRDVRIIYLPPMTIAAIHIIGQDANGEHAEFTSANILDEFIEKTNLKTIYPAARNFGFNKPDGISDDDPNHGYERWISIPDDMEVPAPLVKKRLEGGMYAARVIPMGAWDEGWVWLHEWVSNNKNFDFRWETIDGVCGWLEEHLNYWNWYLPILTQQVDLLMPIKEK